MPFIRQLIDELNQYVRLEEKKLVLVRTGLRCSKTSKTNDGKINKVLSKTGWISVLTLAKFYCRYTTQENTFVESVVQ